MAVAFSGGRDSTALLHATLCAAPPGMRVIALHVHHGLSADADAWLAHCRRQCARWSRRRLLEFDFERLDEAPPAGASVEAWARGMRYAALGRMAREHGVDTVLLAHHQRDQAETFLLQALRGAGVAGLAGMPRAVQRGGLWWLRPWLDRPWSDIERYVRRFRLAHVDDHSNADPRYARSRLRTGVWPALQREFAQADASLADSARWAQQADACLSELAELDLRVVEAGSGELRIARWLELSVARRSNTLRAWLHERAGRAAPASLVLRLLHELRPDTPKRWDFDGAVLRSYRGGLRYSHSASDSAESSRPERESSVQVTGPGQYPLPGWSGVLQVSKAAARAARALPLIMPVELELRPVQGRLQFQRDAATTARSLKKQFQAAAVPAWERGGPLIYQAGVLLFVPGLGADARAFDRPGAERYELRWHVASPAVALDPAG